MKKPPFTPGIPGITGTYDKQVWAGRRNDEAQSLGEVKFDATETILNMPLAAIRKLADCDEASDNIGSQHVEHDGPCSVYIVESVMKFFKVGELSQITQALLDQARSWMREQPLKRFSVRVSFTTYQDIVVEANHSSAVPRIAKEQAAALTKNGADRIQITEINPLAA